MRVEQYVLTVYPDSVMYSFQSQVVQYPRLGAPGIEYFAGHEPAYPKPVDCLLWRDEDGLVRGILNHYPIDMPPHEKAGNMNLFVDPTRHRQGIGSALVREANRRWGPINWSQQRYSAAGVELAHTMIKELGGREHAAPSVQRVEDGVHRLPRKRKR